MMRTLRLFAVVTTAMLATFSLVTHALGIGACLGALLCTWLWRYLLVEWLGAAWHAIGDDLRKGP